MTVEKLGELPSQGWAPVLWPQISGSKACGISVQTEGLCSGAACAVVVNKATKL